MINEIKSVRSELKADIQALNLVIENEVRGAIKILAEKKEVITYD